MICPSRPDSPTRPGVPSAQTRGHHIARTDCGHRQHRFWRAQTVEGPIPAGLRHAAGPLLFAPTEHRDGGSLLVFPRTLSFSYKQTSRLYSEASWTPAPPELAMVPAPQGSSHFYGMNASETIEYKGLSTFRGLKYGVRSESTLRAQTPCTTIISTFAASLRASRAWP
jgi:hypothetical protein